MTERDAVLYVETDGNEDDAMLTFFQGDENMVFQGDQFVSKGKGGLPEDSTGSEQALTLVGLAGQAYVYDHEGGVTEYVLVVEGSALPPDMSFEGVGSVDYVGLHYYLDADGALTELYAAPRRLPRAASPSSSPPTRGTPTSAPRRSRPCPKATRDRGRYLPGRLAGGSDVSRDSRARMSKPSENLPDFGSNYSAALMAASSSS